MQRTNQFDNLFNRHTVTENSRNQFGIVPVFFVELFRQTFNRHLISALVFELEVVTLVAFFVVVLDDTSGSHRFRQQDTFFIILQTGKDFVRTSVEQTYKSNPLLFVILEAYYIRFKYTRTCFYYLRWFAVALFFFIFFFLGWNQHTGTRTVSVYSTAFTARTPSFYIQTVYQIFVYVVRKIDSYTDRVVNPFLDTSLHLHLHQPVYIIGSSLIIRWFCNQVVDFFLSITFVWIVSVYLHPCQEFMVEYDVFFECVSCFVYEIDTYVFVVRINLTAAFVDRHKYRLNTGSSLSHQTGSSGRGNSQTGNIASAILSHFFVQCRICFFQTIDKRVVFFSFCVIDFEGSTFFCHVYRRAVSFKCYNLMYIFWEFGCFFRSVA